MTSSQHFPFQRYTPIYIQDGKYSFSENMICQEIPLGIYINGTSYATLMRTPGYEQELALGFCFTNELIFGADDVSEIVTEQSEHSSDITRVYLTIPDLSMESLRHDALLKSSSGAVNRVDILEDIFRKVTPISSTQRFSLSILPPFPGKLNSCQELRAVCGSTHGAALFDAEGNVLFCAEDVGRHNGLDKLIGHILLNNIKTYDKLLMLSSRASFEMIQKAVKIAFPVVVSISAPTDLALQVADKMGCTYVSFLKKGDFYIYTHPWRFGLSGEKPS